MNTFTGRLALAMLALVVRPLAAQTAAVFETGLAVGSGSPRDVELSWQLGLLGARPAPSVAGGTLFVSAALDGGRQSIAVLPRMRRRLGAGLGVDLAAGPMVLFRRGLGSQLGGTAEVSLGWLEDVSLTGRLDFSDRMAWHGGVKLGTRQAGDGLKVEAAGVVVYGVIKLVEWGLHGFNKPWLPWPWDFWGR